MRCKVKIEDQIYQVEIGDLHDRPVIALVDGIRFDVWPEELSERYVSLTKPKSEKKEHSVAGTPDSTKIRVPTYGKVADTKEVRAPLPGVIKEVLVKPEDEVSYGQGLCVIEAMKMKNTIRAARAGKLAEISAYPGQTVNHNDILMTFTE